jgi:hypothetical protein
MGEKVNERQRRLLVDATGLLLRFVVHAAVSQDHDGTKQALGGIKKRFSRLEYLWADGAYTGEFIDWALRTPRDHSGNRQAFGTNEYTCHRFPPEILSYGVSLCCRSWLSCRTVEELMLEQASS